MDTWLTQTSDGIVLMRLSTIDGVSSMTVDQPAALRFRQPARPVVGRPDGFGARCGWYDGGLLLTQYPETDLGEPMILVQDGDALIRAYPLDDTTLIREDGVELRLGPDRIELHRPGGEPVTLSRSDSYVERPISFRAGSVELEGTLILPATPGPHPAAVAVHGAAGGQRDYCRIFVTAVLAAGVAALIYDKPGHGLSTGDSDPSIFDQAAAASAAIDALAARPEIDPARIGLVGFSNGMWSAPMVAAARPEVAFLAGIGSPGVSMMDAELHRRVKVLREAGIRPDSLAAVERAWRCIFTIHANGSSDPATTAELTAALSEVDNADDLAGFELPGYARHNPMLSPIPPRLPADELVAMLAGPPDPASLHDPADDYRRITCPVFLQYGEHDTSVPVAASVRRIAAAQADAGVSPTIRVYPGLEHGLNVARTDVVGLSAEEAMYLYHGFRFGPGVWSDLTTWLTTLSTKDR